VCYKVQRPSLTGMLGLRMVDVRHGQSGPVVTVYNPELSAICSTIELDLRDCLAKGSGQYLITIESDIPKDGIFGVFDFTSSAGCQTGPSLAFGEPAVVGRVSRRGAVDCMSVPFAAGDQARFALTPGGDAQFQASVVSGTGSRICDYISVPSCRMPNSPGAVRVLTWVPEWSVSGHAGRYRLHAWRLNNPSGCVDIGSLHDGFGPLVGTLHDGTDEVCYRGRASDGDLTITASNDDVPTSVPFVRVLNQRGGVACVPVSEDGCVLFGGIVSILVIGPGGRDFPGHYRVIGDCTSETCGP
jgi:hypothetical protein